MGYIYSGQRMMHRDWETRTSLSVEGSFLPRHVVEAVSCALQGGRNRHWLMIIRYLQRYKYRSFIPGLQILLPPASEQRKTDPVLFANAFWLNTPCSHSLTRENI